MRKILSMLIMCCICLVTVPSPVFAASGFYRTYVSTAAGSSSNSLITARNGFTSTISKFVPYNPYYMQIVTVSGSSWSKFTRNSFLAPQYADSISQSDTFKFQNIGLTPSISNSGASGSISISGNSITLQYPTLTKATSRNNNYSGITASAMAFTSVTQTDSATFLFGSTTLNPSCSNFVNIYF